MPLLLNLMARIAAVVVLCLTCAVGWVMVDAHRSIVAETSMTAERVGSHLESAFWNRIVWRDGMRRPTVLPLPEWETLATLNLIAPGICITFAIPGDEPHRMCAKVDMIGASAPSWFRSFNNKAFGSNSPVRRTLKRDGAYPIALYATVDADTAARLSWNHVSIVVGIAAVLAAAIAVFVTLTIGHALIPARSIVAGLGHLRRGDYSWRLPQFRTAEFRHIARAVNELAQRLADTTTERAALTARLFKVQEEERRGIARDLHDEFGQCLSATSALASVIEVKAVGNQAGIVEDARTILSTQRRMMTALRGTLARLRTQNIEEIGLEASLRELVAQYNVQYSARPAFTLDVPSSLNAVPDPIAVGVYRIAQECLTNAVRHASPTEVRLRVENSVRDDEIAVTVEDDGGGDAARLNAESTGYGLVGIRERLASLDGKLVIANAASGVRIAATIPLRMRAPTTISEVAA